MQCLSPNTCISFIMGMSVLLGEETLGTQRKNGSANLLSHMAKLSLCLYYKDLLALSNDLIRSNL